MTTETKLRDELYEKFGFQDLGKSGSAWGGETWHEMEAVIR